MGQTRVSALRSQAVLPLADSLIPCLHAYRVSVFTEVPSAARLTSIFVDALVIANGGSAVCQARSVEYQGANQV